MFHSTSRHLKVDPVISFYISYKSLPLVFHFRCFETLLLFYIYFFSMSGFLMTDCSCLMHYFSVFGYQMKHSFSCLIYYFSVFGYQMKLSFSCLIYYFSVFGYQIKLSFSRLICYFSVFGYQMKDSFSCLI